MADFTALRMHLSPTGHRPFPGQLNESPRKLIREENRFLRGGLLILPDLIHFFDASFSSNHGRLAEPARSASASSDNKIQVAGVLLLFPFVKLFNRPLGWDVRAAAFVLRKIAEATSRRPVQAQGSGAWRRVFHGFL
jgi:hypothetical protein